MATVPDATTTTAAVRPATAVRTVVTENLRDGSSWTPNGKRDVELDRLVLSRVLSTQLGDHDRSTRLELSRAEPVSVRDSGVVHVRTSEVEAESILVEEKESVRVEVNTSVRVAEAETVRDSRVKVTVWEAEQFSGIATT